MPSDYQKKKLAKKKEISKIKGGKKPTEAEKASENGGSDDNEPQTNGNGKAEDVALTYEGI